VAAARNIYQEEHVARVIVDVMLKPEILDPQGQAIARALPRLGFSGVSDVRQGKRFEVELDGPADQAALEDVRKMAETLLANTVIEDFAIHIEE
jgi:phosphoribosylformylglycinamidine synthase